MPEQESSEVNTAPPSERQSASKLLSAAREGLQLTQKEVADKLFLTTSFIQYIDEGEFDRIPKQAFVKGYLRTYARVVGLSGDEIVAVYEAELEATTPAPEIRGVTEEKVGTSAITGPVLQSGLIGLVGLLVVISLIWYLVSDDDDPVKVVPAKVESSVGLNDRGPPAAADFDFIVADSETNPVLPAGDQAQGDVQFAVEDAATTQPDQSAATLDAAVALASADTGDQSSDGQDLQAMPVPADEAAVAALEVAGDAADAAEDDPIRFERTSDGDRSVIKVDAGGYDQLVLSFSDECWVEVRDAERGLVYNDLNRPADMLTVYGSAPFSVLLGKATGVEMIYNGRPFDLAQHTGPDSTAKFTVAD